MTPRLLRIAVLAMGGEGGGVLADWLVDLAEHAGHVAQTTSVPGVAQRTGATIYYVEMLLGAGIDARPVMALMPLPGDVDIVIASELMEAARAVQRGLVTPGRTVLVASTHRVYAIAEKTAMGDGRADPDALLASARGAAARLVGFDMARMAEEQGSVISAVLFGALAATGALPFSRAQFEATIERGGVGVKPSLRAFGVAHAYVGRDEPAPTPPAAAFADVASPAAPAAALADPASRVAVGADAAPPVAAVADAAPPLAVVADPAPPLAARADPIQVASVSFAPDPPSSVSGPAEAAALSKPQQADGALPYSAAPAVRALISRVGAAMSGQARLLALEGVRRLVDYQGAAWAGSYLDRIDAVRRVLEVVAVASAGRPASQPAQGLVASPDADPCVSVSQEVLLCELARHLALWMSWEDTVRVAELKIRASRFDRVRGEVRADDAQVLAIQEYLHPRLQEIAETLPSSIGRHLLSGGWLGRLVDRLASKGRVVETSSLRGFLLLWGVSRLKRWRPVSLRFAVETARIDAWLDDVRAALARGDAALALEIVRCQRLVKGYGDTHARGWRSFQQLQAWWRANDARSAGDLAALRAAALADEHGHALARALSSSDPAQA